MSDTWPETTRGLECSVFLSGDFPTPGARSPGDDIWCRCRLGIDCILWVNLCKRCCLRCSWRFLGRENTVWLWCGVVWPGRDVNGAANDFFDSANKRTFNDLLFF